MLNKPGVRVAVSGQNDGDDSADATHDGFNWNVALLNHGWIKDSNLEKE